MSLVTLIRDYVDVANSTEKLDGYTLSSLAYHTIIFLFTVAKQAIVYCFTFHWLRDLTYFCFTPPLILSSFANIGEVEKFIGEPSTPLSHLLAFSDWNFSAGVGIVFVGFFNGFSSCMHLSAAHLITIRRMLVQGVPAGLYSALGTAIGQLFFIASIFFGFRGLLFPWLALEPLQFLVGTGIILSVASTMAQDRRTPTIQWSAKSSLFLYFCTNAALAWCEQAALFQWMGNFSLGAEPTFLETTPSSGLVIDLAKGQGASNLIPNFWSITFACAQNLTYLFAFLGGSVLGAFLIAFLLQRFLELILRYKKIAVYYGLVKQANLPLATLLFAFGFGSMPYYGFDYLVTKGFGFIPQEHFFKQTLFSPINLVSSTPLQAKGSDSPQNRLEDQLALFFTLEGERSKSFAVDTTPFDAGQYLKTSQKRPQAFEDLNYRGEHLWTNRLSRISNIREQANQTQSSFLGPLFSWMRSFLWGDEPGSILTNSATNANKFASEMVHYDETPIREKAIFPGKTSLSPPMQAMQSKDPQGRDIKSSASEVASDYSSYNRIDGERQFGVTGADAIYKKEFSSEMEESDNYLKEFDKQFDKGFSNFYDADPPSLIEVEDQWQEKRIKEKCYKNPIYKFLLNTEIDAFLARQPYSHWLSPEEEILLLKRRQVLGNYYDTLALTNQVSTNQALVPLERKSYANTIYNHQFKGTLKVARRLFSIKKASTRTVKFDQPLFLNEKENKKGASAKPQQILFHEELLPYGTHGDAGFPKENVTSPMSEVSASLAPHVQTPEMQKLLHAKRKTPLFSEGKSIHQEINSDVNHLQKEASLITNKIDGETLLLEQAESSPLYAGWDEQLRKFIVTNKYQNRTLAGYTFSKYPERFPDNSQAVTTFTTWPIPNPLFDNVANLPLSNQKPSLNSEDSLISKSDISPGFPKENKTNTKSINQFSRKDALLQSTAMSASQGKEKGIASKMNQTSEKLQRSSFLFQSKPATNDLVNALLQWQKLIKENKPQETVNKQVAKEKISYWPDNIRRANWSNEIVENDMEFDEPAENLFKKKILLWEFIPPYHGGFVWSTTSHSQ